MIRILVFDLVLLGVAVFALRRGGGPERLVASLMVIATIATAAVPLVMPVTFKGVAWGFLGVDLVFFAAMIAVVVLADRYWPMWIAALQLNALAIHGVRAYDPGLVPLIYAWSSGQIAYPMLLLLAIGTARHRGRERAHGTEAGWLQRERVRIGSRGDGAEPRR